MVSNIDPYMDCPVYRTEHLKLRLVEHDDAVPLLACYSDRNAVARMNADNCSSDFYFTTPDEMHRCIEDWLGEYAKRSYVRFAVVYGDMPVGTAELFVTDIGRLKRTGVLRIDLASAYENEVVLAELAELAACGMMTDFQAKSLIIKLGHVPQRAEVFRKYGFTPTKQPKGGYYLY